MLRFERAVVTALIETTDPDVRVGVEEFVASTLAAMPEHLRAGVAIESLALGAWARVRGAGSSLEANRAVVARLTASRVAPVRQYVRLFRSLVVFAEQELAS